MSNRDYGICSICGYASEIIDGAEHVEHLEYWGLPAKRITGDRVTGCCGDEDWTAIDEEHAEEVADYINGTLTRVAIANYRAARSIEAKKGQGMWGASGRPDEKESA